LLVQAFAAGPVFVITAKAVIQVFILDSVPHTPVLIERGWIPSGFRRNDGPGRRRLERFEPFDCPQARLREAVERLERFTP